MIFDQLRKKIVEKAIRGQLVPQVQGECLSSKGPYEIPKTWRWVRLADIATNIEYGTSIKCHDVFEDQDIPVIRMGNIKNGKLILDDLKFAPRSSINLQKLSLKNGDIIFNRTNSRELVGKCAVFYGEENKFSFASYIIRARCCKQQARYISEYINSDLCRSTQILPFITQQVGQANFNGTKLKNVLIPLPPFEEQVRIVEKLEKTFTEIDRAEKAYEELQTLAGVLRGQILQEAIQGKLVPQLAEEGVVEQIGAAPKEVPFTIPESWKWCYMKGITQKIHYGFTASAANAGNAKLLRITDIQDGRVNWDTVPFCDVPEKKLAPCKLGESDVVIARTGGTIGKSFLLTDVSDVAVFASYLIRLIPCAEVVNPRYLMVFLNSQEYWKQLKAMSQGTGQPNVNAKSLSTLLLPVPPLDEQARIVAKVKELLKHVDALSAK